jgi:hypothetical protein
LGQTCDICLYLQFWFWASIPTWCLFCRCLRWIVDYLDLVTQLDWFEGKHFAEPISKLHRLQPCNLSKIILNLFDICGTLDYHPLYMSYDDKKLYHSFGVLCTHICLNLFIFLGEGNSLFTDNRPSLGTERCLGVPGGSRPFLTLVWIPWNRLPYHICHIHFGYITTGSDCLWS